MASKTGFRIINVGRAEAPCDLGPRDLTHVLPVTIPLPTHLRNRPDGTARFQERFSQEMNRQEIEHVQDDSQCLPFSFNFSGRSRGCMAPVTSFFKQVFAPTPAQPEMEMREMPHTVVTVQPGREPAMGLNLNKPLPPMPPSSPLPNRPAAHANVLGHHPGGLADEYYGLGSLIHPFNSSFVIGDGEDEEDDSSVLGSLTSSIVAIGNSSELDTADSSIQEVRFVQRRASLFSDSSNESETVDQSPVDIPQVHYATRRASLCSLDEDDADSFPEVGALMRVSHGNNLVRPAHPAPSLFTDWHGNFTGDHPTQRRQSLPVLSLHGPHIPVVRR